MTIDQRIYDGIIKIVERCKHIDSEEAISFIIPKADQEDIIKVQEYVRDKTGYWPVSIKGKKGYGIEVNPSMIR